MNSPQYNLVRTGDGLEVDLAQVPHGLAPKLFEPVCQAAGQIAVAHKQRREPPFGHKGVVEGQHDGLLVHDMERVAEFSGIANSGEVSNFGPMASKELDEDRRSLIGEPEDDTVFKLALPGVSSDTSQERKPRGHGLVDRREVTAFHVGEDPGGGRR